MTTRLRRFTHKIHLGSLCSEPDPIGNWVLADDAEDTIERLRAALETVAAQHSGEVCSTKLSDCMAAFATATLREGTT